MVRTRVGYAGGKKVNPTYENLGDHSESIQVDYDPTQITYEELLEVFWSGHRCDRPSYSLQYASRVFYHNEEQRQLAEASKARQKARLGTEVFTAVVPAGEFYLAEDYHQKYILQGRRPLLDELRAIYPQFSDFVNSTLAARLNGYAGGNVSQEQFEAEVDSYGLSETSLELLRRMAR